MNVYFKSSYLWPKIEVAILVSQCEGTQLKDDLGADLFAKLLFQTGDGNVHDWFVKHSK